MRIKTLKQAARFVEDAGFAFVFPDNKTPLPSLWGAIAGNPRREMDEEDWGWTKAVERAWDFKNLLGEKRLAYFGRVFRGKGSLVSLEMLPALRAAVASDAPLSPLADRAITRLRHVGAMSTLRLRESLGLDRAKFDRVVLELYRRLLIATVGTDDTETRWPSGVVDAFEHAYPREAKARVKDPLAVLVPKFRAFDLTDRQIAALIGVTQKLLRKKRV